MNIMEKIHIIFPFFRTHPKATLTIFSILFAFLAIAGQVGQNVSLPLWANAASSNCSPYHDNNITGEMESFFIVSFASLAFVVFFGICTAIVAIVDFKTIKENLKFPQWQLILIGMCDAFNGLLVVFSASPKRTAPFLQAILGNIVIPLTIVLRIIILRKKPTILKLISAGIVLIGLILSLIPVITGIDKDSAHGKKEWLQQSTASRILWPLCFMIGFIPATFMNVIEEMSLKDSRKVNLFYLLFCTSFYQLITVWVFFWLDIIPHFGNAQNIQEFGENYKFAMKCFFGGDTCDAIPWLRGTSFIVMYIISYIGGGLLLRYAEGATYLAIVQALVTPLGALFWSLFSTDECGGFFWGPHSDSLTYFSIGGIILIFPAILLYNVNVKEVTKLKNKLLGIKDTELDGEIQSPSYTEKSPLLN